MSGGLRHRLRVQVTLAAVGVTLLAALAGAVLFLGALHQSLQGSLLEGARQQAASVAARLAAGSTPEAAVASGRDDVVLQVLGPAGRILASDHPELTTPIVRAPGDAAGIAVPVLGDRFAVVAQRAASGHLVVVGTSEEDLDRSMRVAYGLVAAGVPLAMLLVGAVVWVAVGRALRPVEVMRREAAAITAEHLHRRLAVPPGDDEIPLLAATLNGMLDRIDAAQRRQRQFVADASHELRSPLAVVRQLVEVAQRHPESTSAVELAREVAAEEQRMEDLVVALLTLARLDDGAVATTQVLDLDDLVHGEVERLRVRDVGIVIDRHGVGAARVHGDPVLWTQVVANLLGNGARHARERVLVTLGEAGGRAVLVVEDDGPGIPPAEREAVFERFVRLDEARARDAGGAGLGLAIVRDVVTLAGGSVRIEDATLGGARFVVDAPGAAD